jgi:hypothetical protein
MTTDGQTARTSAHSASAMTGFPFDDVRGEFGRVAASDIPHRVDHPARDGQRVTGVACPRRLALDLVPQRPFEDVDDLFTRMGVPDRCRFGAYVDALLDDLSSGRAEIVLLQFGAPQSRRLLDPSARAAGVLGRAHHASPGYGRDDVKAFTAACHHPGGVVSLACAVRAPRVARARGGRPQHVRTLRRRLTCRP